MAVYSSNNGEGADDTRTPSGTASKTPPLSTGAEVPRQIPTGEELFGKGPNTDLAGRDA